MEVVNARRAPLPGSTLNDEARQWLRPHTLSPDERCSQTIARLADQPERHRPGPAAVKTSRGILRRCGSSAPNVEPNSRYRITIQCAPSAQHAASCSTWGVGSTT